MEKEKQKEEDKEKEKGMGKGKGKEKMKGKEKETPAGGVRLQRALVESLPGSEGGGLGLAYSRLGFSCAFKGCV